MQHDSTKPKAGRVIRGYAKQIPSKDFDKWRDLTRGRKWRGLYALYQNDKLIYVGLATKSIRSRISRHLGEIPFTHFSVFRVTGSSPEEQGRRIRDLEALLLNILRPRTEWNKNKTKFVAAKKLKV